MPCRSQLLLSWELVLSELAHGECLLYCKIKLAHYSKVILGRGRNGNFGQLDILQGQEQTTDNKSKLLGTILFISPVPVPIPSPKPEPQIAHIRDSH